MSKLLKVMLVSLLTTFSLFAFFPTDELHAQRQENISAKQANASLEDIQKDSSELERLLRLLDDPNPSVRTAAFDAILRTNNRSWIERAISAAATTSDRELREQAVRAYFKFVKTLNLEVMTSSGQGSKEPPNQAIMSINISEYSDQTGAFSGRGSIGNVDCKGEVQGSMIRLHFHHCSGNLYNKESFWEFVGPVDCTVNLGNIHTGNQIGRIKLR